MVNQRRMSVGNAGPDYLGWERDNLAMNKLQQLTAMMGAEERGYDDASKKLLLKKKEVLRQQSKFRSEREERKVNTEELKILRDDTEQLNLRLSARILSVRDLKNKIPANEEVEKKSRLTRNALNTAFRNLNLLKVAFDKDESLVNGLKEEVTREDFSVKLQHLNNDIDQEKGIIAKYESSLQAAKQGHGDLVAEKGQVDEEAGALQQEKNALLAEVSSGQDRLQQLIDEIGHAQSLDDKSSLISVAISELQAHKGRLGDSVATTREQLRELSNQSACLQSRLASLEDRETGLMLSADATRLGIDQQKVVVASLQTALQEAKAAQFAEVRKRDSIAQELSQMADAMKDMLRSREHVQLTTAKFRQQLLSLSLTETETDGEDSLPPPHTSEPAPAPAPAPAVSTEDKHTWQSLARIEADMTGALAALQECEATRLSLSGRKAEARRLLDSEYPARGQALQGEARRLTDDNAAMQTSLESLQGKIYAASPAPAMSQDQSTPLLRLLHHGGHHDETGEESKRDFSEEEEEVGGESLYSMLSGLLGFHVDPPMLGYSAAGKGDGAGTDVDDDGDNDGDGDDGTSASALVRSTLSLLGSIKTQRDEFRFFLSSIDALQNAVDAKTHSVTISAGQIHSREQSILAASLKQAKKAPAIKEAQKAHRAALALLTRSIEEEDTLFRARFAQLDSDFKAQDEAFEADYRSKLKQLQSMKINKILGKGYAQPSSDAEG